MIYLKPIPLNRGFHRNKFCYIALVRLCKHQLKNQVKQPINFDLDSKI